MIGDISKPIQIKKAIGIPTRRTSITSNTGNTRQPLKRRPSVSYLGVEDKGESKDSQDKNNFTSNNSNNALRPKSISKTILEEVKAKRAIQISSNTENKKKKDSQKKIITLKSESNHKLNSKLKQKKTEDSDIKLNKKDSIIKQNINELPNVHVPNYKEIQNKDLNDQNKANIAAVVKLAALKAQEIREKNKIIDEKNYRKSIHENNLSNVNKLINQSREYLNLPIIQNKNNSESTNMLPYKNMFSIIEILLDDKYTKMEYIEELLMIENSYRNIWGISTKDINEIYEIINYFQTMNIDLVNITQQISLFRWFFSKIYQKDDMGFEMDEFDFTIRNINNRLINLNFSDLKVENIVNILMLPLFSVLDFNYSNDIFKLLDVDGDGNLSINDIKDILKEIKWEGFLSDDEIEILLKCTIFNKNLSNIQEVSQVEFINFCNLIFQM